MEWRRTSQIFLLLICFPWTRDQVRPQGETTTVSDLPFPLVPSHHQRRPLGWWQGLDPWEYYPPPSLTSGDLLYVIQSNEWYRVTFTKQISIRNETDRWRNRHRRLNNVWLSLCCTRLTRREKEYPDEISIWRENKKVFFYMTHTLHCP